MERSSRTCLPKCQVGCQPWHAMCGAIGTWGRGTYVKRNTEHCQVATGHGPGDLRCQGEIFRKPGTQRAPETRRKPKMDYIARRHTHAHTAHTAHTDGYAATVLDGPAGGPACGGADVTPRQRHLLWS